MRHPPIISFFSMLLVLVCCLGLSKASAAENLFPSPSSCIKAYQSSDLVMINRNATTPIENYRQKNNRNLNSYENNIGPEFEKSISLLKPNEIFVDVGSGFGNASIELVRNRPGTRAIAINAQDAWAFIKEIPEPDADKNLSPQSNPYAVQSEIYAKLVERIGGEVKALQLATVLGVTPEELSKTHGISYSRGYEAPYFTPGFYRDVLERIRDAYKKNMSSGTFIYKVGFAENVLQSLTVKAKILADLFGAYFYSINRAQLLKEYYETLSPGGESYVIIESNDFHNKKIVSYGPKTFIEGTNQTFEDYLVATYPSIFSIHIHERRGLADSDIKYLKIRKSQDPSSLDLKFSVAKYTYDNDDEVPIRNQIPIVILRPKK
jgi:SAM-dependent methyltransferase